MNIKTVLQNNGLLPFMNDSGKSIHGVESNTNTSFKIMTSKNITYNQLLEIEKNAETMEDALHKEIAIYELVKEKKCEKYCVRKEPPSMVFEKTT